MKPVRRPLIRVEQLEQRDCPSLSVFLSGSTLFVRGVPTANSATGLQITQTANNIFSVIDNGHNLGTYVAANVSLNLVNHQGSPVNIDLGGHSAAGNITANLGAGDTTGDLFNGVALFDGTVAGNVTVSGGSGVENVLLGENTEAQLQAANLVIGGNLTVNAKVDPNSIGDILDTGLDTGLDPTIRIGGNLVTTAVNGVGLNDNTTVGGNVLLSAAGDVFNNNSNTLGVFLSGTIGGNVTIVGTPATPGAFGDQVFMSNFLLGSGKTPTIGGNLTISLGSGAETVSLAGSIGGSASVSTGNGNSTIVTGATVGGVPAALTVNNNLSFHLGNGDNTFTDGTTNAAGLSANTIVNGNLTIATGAGTDNFGTIAATVNGNETIDYLDRTPGGGGAGGGGSVPNAILTGYVGGLFTWISGNGGDALTIQGSAAATWYNVNVQFGNGDDTFTVGGGATPVMVSGRADGGGRATANVYNQLANGVLGPHFVLSNFP